MLKMSKRGLGSLTGLLSFGIAGCSFGMNTLQESVAPEEPFLPFSQSENQPIMYSATVINSFIHIYEGRAKELPICLIGEKRKDSSYSIYDIEIPFITQANDSTADYNPCSKGEGKVEGYIGLAHNHPSGSCLPSLIDMERFIRDERDTAEIEVIVCDVDFPDALTLQTYIKSYILREFSPEVFLDHYGDFLISQGLIETAEN